MFAKNYKNQIHTRTLGICLQQQCSTKSISELTWNKSKQLHIYGCANEINNDTMAGYKDKYINKIYMESHD